MCYAYIYYWPRVPQLSACLRSERLSVTMCGSEDMLRSAFSNQTQAAQMWAARTILRPAAAVPYQQYAPTCRVG